MLKRVVCFVYGAAAYAVFLGTFLYAIGFIGNIAVANSIDATPGAPLGRALLIDTLLLGVFAVQHSVMARQWFKRGLTKLLPEAVERSTYVLLSSLALILMFWKWEPIGGTVWSIESPAGRMLMWGAYAVGWKIVLAATFLINHFDLFGMRQVTLFLLGRKYEPLAFRTPGLYKMVRHPLYVGWVMVFWSTPVMTSAHLLFAVMTTAHILVAIQFEERDLKRMHPEYAAYAQRVPMMIPSLPKAEVTMEADAVKM